MDLKSLLKNSKIRVEHGFDNRARPLPAPGGDIDARIDRLMRRTFNTSTDPAIVKLRNFLGLDENSIQEFLDGPDDADKPKVHRRLGFKSEQEMEEFLSDLEAGMGDTEFREKWGDSHGLAEVIQRALKGSGGGGPWDPDPSSREILESSLHKGEDLSSLMDGVIRIGKA